MNGIVRRIYLDHSATTPADERVVVAMTEFLLSQFGNPSSAHSFGREARDAVEEARLQVANMIGAARDEVFFTSGGTEADNLAIFGVMQAGDKRHLITSTIEHSAVLAPARELQRQGFEVTFLSPDAFGLIDPESVRASIRPDTGLISIMHANNEIGTINPIGEIGRVASASNIPFHTDAVQSFGKVPIDVRAMKIDLLSLSSHKIYGPKGVGALYLRQGIPFQPRQFGGHQERNVRPGTENVQGFVGLGTATAICASLMTNESERLTKLAGDFFSMLYEALGGITLNGHPNNRLPGNVNVSFTGVEAEALLISLDLEGIAVSTGSACSTGSAEPSHVLTGIGLTAEEANSTLRISLGRGTTRMDLDYAAKVIIDAVQRLREMSGWGGV